MPVYTVHAPVANNMDFRATDRFAFVRDGFHFWAAVFGVVWAVLVAYGTIRVIQAANWTIRAARRYLCEEEPPAAAVTDAAGSDLHTERNLPRAS